MGDNLMLTAIERLTTPHRSLVAQQNDAGISCVSVVEHLPLLHQLKNAIGGNIGRHANVTQAREKIPLNTGALELFEQIANQVDKWLRARESVRRPAFEQLWSAVSRWYIVYENDRRRGRYDRATERDIERTIHGWVRDIDNMFDPPTVFEITRIFAGHDVPERCPVCFNSHAIDPKTSNRVTALVIEYRNLGHDTLTHANAHCRFCGELWPGSHGIRSLRWELDQNNLSPEEAAKVARFGLDMPEMAA